MKTLWVNRHHADGSVKQMSEWVQVNIHNKTTHIKIKGDKVFQKTYGLKGDIVSSDPRVGVYRYIGNQRGDGWFYVADGDLPPIEDNAVLCHDGYGLLLMMPADLHRKNAWNHRNKAKCWMPIPDPKHLD